MKGRWLWAGVGALTVALAALLGLVLKHPKVMLAPGALAKGHTSLSTDCFACHTPFKGATAERCISCHKVESIGLRSTQGAPLPSSEHAKVAFHQALTEPNCLACHSEHEGTKLKRQARKPFKHSMLQAATRGQCSSCHSAPANAWHPKPTAPCASCHQTEAWKPATFDHSRFFVLDGHHKVACSSCHNAAKQEQVSCYGCHEHTPANTQEKHLEEGVSEVLEPCVRCHRNGKGEEAGGEERKAKEGKGEPGGD